MLELRDAKIEDSELIVEYIRELAEFENLMHEFATTPELIREWLFGDKRHAQCMLVEFEGRPAGFAIYFYNFSSFLGKPGIYIEDVFVRPDFRRKGIARKIFKHLAQKALEEGCRRLGWSVLSWNRNAIELYKSFGAESLDEWVMQRVKGEALQKLANAD